MSDLWNRIAGALAWLRGKDKAATISGPRSAACFICSCAVTWESGGARGEGVVREVSPTGLRLRTGHALVAGRRIQIRPVARDGELPVPLDVATGTVISSKARKGGITIEVELTHPERLSRFAWICQLRKPGPGPLLPLPRAVIKGLHIVDPSPRWE